MELEKLTKDDIWGFTSERLKEVQTDIRKELAMARMKIFNNEGKVPSAAKKKMKKSLARILTLESENKRKNKK